MFSDLQSMHPFVARRLWAQFSFKFLEVGPRLAEERWTVVRVPPQLSTTT